MSVELVELVIRRRGFVIDRGRKTASVDLDAPDRHRVLDQLLRAAADIDRKGDISEYEMDVTPKNGRSFTHVIAQG